uniref:Uncharacterized protein n=1 Tax=Romanomermis culicivorax TaxID=13658 RepID=A0A915KE62_ROMCU
MPSAPLIRTVGIMGQYQNGSIRLLSSLRYSRIGSSSGWNSEDITRASRVFATSQSRSKLTSGQKEIDVIATDKILRQNDDRAHQRHFAMMVGRHFGHATSQLGDFDFAFIVTFQATNSMALSSSSPAYLNGILWRNRFVVICATVNYAFPFACAICALCICANCNWATLVFSFIIERAMDALITTAFVYIGSLSISSERHVKQVPAGKKRETINYGWRDSRIIIMSLTALEVMEQLKVLKEAKKMKKTSSANKCRICFIVWLNYKKKFRANLAQCDECDGWICGNCLMDDFDDEADFVCQICLTRRED